MNKQLLSKINRALKYIKPGDKGPAYLRRYREEMNWADADADRWACIQLLNDVMEAVRVAGIVTSPGYSFLTCSFLLYLAGVTRVDPVAWDLPFSRFLRSFGNGNKLILETGTGGISVAEKVLRGRDEFIVETEPGTFRINFLEGNSDQAIDLTIIEYAQLDLFKTTLKDGWHPLDEATLRLFGRGDTDDSIWFETDKMREWLTEFGPESMSDLVLLNALYHPSRIGLYPEVLRRKQSQDYDARFQDTYGIPVYQEQSTTMPTSYELALKGHYIARTMLSVEALWHRRHKTSLK